MSLLRAEEVRTLVAGPIRFAVDPGACVCITGPSGSGKTLILRALSDLDPHEGRVYLDDVESRDMPAPVWRRAVGMLPAESQWWHDTVGEHFTSNGCSFLAPLGFESDVLDWTVSRLSSGERQRLALARLLEGAPRALLLDEPTANLDAENTARVESLVAAYRRDHDAPVVWIGHEREQIRRVADRRYELGGGILREMPA